MLGTTSDAFALSSNDSHYSCWSSCQSSPSSACLSKKEVGGSWCWPPAITWWRPRQMQLAASCGRTLHP